jgi:hypothetical protein
MRVSFLFFLGVFLYIAAVEGNMGSIIAAIIDPSALEEGINTRGNQSNGIFSPSSTPNNLTPSLKTGPGQQPNPPGCHNDVNAKTSPWPPFVGLDKNGCCPDGFSRWDIGAGAITCRNMWNVTIG